MHAQPANIRACTHTRTHTAEISLTHRDVTGANSAHQLCYACTNSDMIRRAHTHAAEIPLTHRDVSDTIIITTGRGRGGSVPDFPPYRADNTLVLLMAVGRLGMLSESLVGEKGYPAFTPVCVVEKATCPGVCVCMIGCVGHIFLTSCCVRMAAPTLVCM